MIHVYIIPQIELWFCFRSFLELHTKVTLLGISLSFDKLCPCLFLVTIDSDIFSLHNSFKQMKCIKWISKEIFSVMDKAERRCQVYIVMWQEEILKAVFKTN